MADYAISNVPRRVVYAASGVGPYAFTFEILVNTDVAVYRDDTLLTLSTDYTVSIAANGTGTVTLTALPTGATQIAIVGSRAIQRTSDFVTGGDFFANTVNDELDSLTIFAQQNAEGLARALQAPQTDPLGIDMTLPRAAVRANKTLAFDANGNPVTGEVVGDNRGDWAAGISYNKRDIAKDTTNGNVYYVNTAHTSSGVLPIDTNADAAKWDLLVDNASAGASAAAAAASETAAAGSASAASTSASNAASSASAAATSASGAATSATNAAASETAASGSATTASSAETNASASASAASASATNAANSETAAGTSATNASGSATAAAASETAAAASASSAATSASTATTQASNASTSATNAASSATAAATSATSALASLDEFKGQYYGSASSDPTVDPLGNAPTAGDLYFNTTTNRLRVYSATAGVWLEGNAGSVAVQNFNGTGSQTAFTLSTSPESENNTQVYISGVYQQKDQYSISGTTLTFTSAPPAGTNNIEVVTLNTLPLGVTSADLVQFQPAGTGAVLRTVEGKQRDSVSVKDFGAVGDGVTDDTAAIQAAVDAVRAAGGGTINFPTGTYLVSTTIDLFQGSAINLVLRGAARSSTTIRTTANIVVFNHAENCAFEDFTVTQAGTAKTGRAFSTPTNKQAAYCVYSRLSVNGFKYGIWWRYSLWCSLRDVRFDDCGAGLKASRNAFPDDQTNPAAPGSWNLDPGFFHNQNTFDNVLCDGGEVGILGTFNGCVFDNVTCQGQNDSSGASNVVLPVGEQGVGMWLQGSASATGIRFGAQGNLISNYYTEFTRQPLIVDRAQVRLDSYYLQGGSSGARYPQGIKAINSAVIDGQGAAASGSDWFDNRVVATDSTLRGDIGVGSANGNVSSLTSSTWFRNNGSGAGVNVNFSLTGTGLTQTLYTMPRQIGAVRVCCTVLRDGFQVRYGSWTVYFWQSGLGAVVADSENFLGATITVSGSSIVYTTTESLSHGVIAHVLPMAFLGQTRTSGLYDVP